MIIDRRNVLRWSGVSLSALIFGSCALATSAAGEWPGPDTPATQIPKLPIGMNLAEIADWSAGFPFRNLMWGARPWMTRNADGSGPWNTDQLDAFTFDDDGYPVQVPAKRGETGTPQRVFTILPNVLKPGKYVLLHDGDGTFAGMLGTSVLSQTAGRAVLHMTHRSDLLEALIITRSNPANPLRNIRIVAVEDEHHDLAQDPFLPEFLEFCQPFHALRFMDWGATNGSIEEEWAHRRRPSFYTMVPMSGDPDAKPDPTGRPFSVPFSGGVAYEVMIALANALDADPWFCIPHRANADYIAQFAKLVRERLDRKRTVYVEFSNEIWNWQFPQAGWMLHSRRAGDLVEAKGGKAWDDAAKTKGSNHPERIGALFGAAFTIWEREWQGPDRKRLVRVCATQTGWLDVALRTLDSCMTNGGCDAVAQSGYFGPWDAHYAHWATRGAALTADDVIDDLRIVVARQAQGCAALTVAQRAAKLGLRYLVYEGGQHVQPKNQAETPYNPALGAAQTHPAMYDLYLETLRTERHLNCSLFCAFNSVSTQGSRYGSWGAKRSYAESTASAPKYRALLTVNTIKA